MSAEELRRWAERCATDALRFRADEDRDRLLRMRDALLALAADEEGLLAPLKLAEAGDRIH